MSAVKRSLMQLELALNPPRWYSDIVHEELARELAVQQLEQEIEHADETH